MSIYDNINSAIGLVKEVQAHALSTKLEDLNRAADIIGHSPVDELVVMAREPKVSGTLFLILKNVWNLEEVIRFWNNYVNPEREKLEKLEKLAKTAEKNAANLKAKNEALTAERNEYWESLSAVRAQLEASERRTQQAEAEIMRLKAMLFDYMTKTA